MVDLTKAQRCAAAKASVSAASACVTHPLSGACTGRSVNVMTSPASGSVESFVEVRTRRNPVRKTKGREKDVEVEESADTLWEGYMICSRLWNVNERITC